MAKGTARGTWTRLYGERAAYIERARDCAELTLPFLYPRTGPNNGGGGAALSQPWNSLGARGVNNLSAKLLLSFLPPNTPFFRLSLNREETRALLVQDQQSAASGATKEGQILQEFDYAFSEMEKEIMDEIEGMQMRPRAFEAMRHLLVAGNGLLSLTADGKWKFRSLESYVIERGPDDAIVTLVIKECVSRASLSEELASLLPKREAVSADAPSDDVEVFTVVERRDGKYKEWQEIEDAKVPKSTVTYELNALPHMALRWNRVSGESYGRGLVEEYIGDLISLDQITKSIVEGALAMSRLLILVNPNGSTKAKTLQDAKNGTIAMGTADDVSVVQMEKYGDFRVAMETATKIEQRIAQAFLLNSSVQRPGERVTATEIRAMIAELESTLGGVFATLSQEFSYPTVELVTQWMMRKKRLRALPKGKVRPVVITGLDALGRGQDLQKLDVFLMGLRDTLGPEVIAQFIDVKGIITKRAGSLGLDINGLVKTDEQIQQEAQSAQQQRMMDTIGAPAVTALGGIAKQGMAQGAPQLQQEGQQ